MPRRNLVGKVVSDKMDKTVTVVVEDRKSHPKYGKILSRSKKYHAHDEENKAKVGDRVRIIESRPMSRSKRWALEAVVEEAIVL